MATLGSNVTRRELSDTFLDASSSKAHEHTVDGFKKLAIQELRNAYRVADKDEAQTNDYLRRAKAWMEKGNMNAYEISKLLHESSQGYENMIDRVKKAYSFEHAPADQIAPRQKQYYGIGQ